MENQLQCPRKSPGFILASVEMRLQRDGFPRSQTGADLTHPHCNSNCCTDSCSLPISSMYPKFRVPHLRKPYIHSSFLHFFSILLNHTNSQLCASLNSLHPLHELLKELEESFPLIISFTLSLSTLKDYMQAIKIHCQLINYYMQYSDLCVSKLVSSVNLSLFLEVIIALYSQD